jgi:hypothetical protein
MFLSRNAVCSTNEQAIAPGAQTERRGDGGPVKSWLGRKASPADSPLET